MSNTDCAPRVKNAALPAPRPLIAGTGPGPEGGGMNGPGDATQPTPGLGAKSGGEPAPAASAGPRDNANAAIPAAMTDADMEFWLMVLAGKSRIAEGMIRGF